ncbi:hypothetical protein DPMN_030209 [Dreissena polymorpha]|uniref:Uncharacterized protein n=1 Tax=Dreissena polymorpha TaxID=45954 RepID=A0A9D4M0G3_DREPO|nr:hypothetical protein DPMN_030209 [Dreissena polymorpha]
MCRYRRQWPSECSQAGSVHGRLRAVPDRDYQELHGLGVERGHQEGKMVDRILFC